MTQADYRGITRIPPGSERPAVDGLDLQIADDEFMVLAAATGQRVGH